MNISVLGCGWLGFPLAQRLLANNYVVKGSTTTPKKFDLIKQNEIDPYLVTLPESFEDSGIDQFWKSDLYVVNIPPGRGSENCDSGYESIISKIIDKGRHHKISWIIFTSSTSVYNELGGVTTEEDAQPGKPPGHRGRFC